MAMDSRWNYQRPAEMRDWASIMDDKEIFDAFVADLSGDLGEELSKVSADHYHLFCTKGHSGARGPCIRGGNALFILKSMLEVVNNPNIDFAALKYFANVASSHLPFSTRCDGKFCAFQPFMLFLLKRSRLLCIYAVAAQELRGGSVWYAGSYTILEYAIAQGRHEIVHYLVSNYQHCLPPDIYMLWPSAQEKRMFAILIRHLPRHHFQYPGSWYTKPEMRKRYMLIRNQSNAELRSLVWLPLPLDVLQFVVAPFLKQTF